MSLGVHQRETLDRLLFALRDGELTDPQAAELEQIVLSDVEAMDHYLRVVNLASGLRWMLQDGGFGQAVAEESEVDGSPIPPIVIDTTGPSGCPVPSAPSPLSGWFVAYAAATVIVGAAILGAWVYNVSPISKQAQGLPQLVEQNRARPEETVGRVREMADCRWGKAASGARAAGEPISRGRKYVLDSGLLELAYNSGAKVVLQGPCVYEVESDHGGVLSLGKLTARVEGSGKAGGRGAKSEIRNPKSEVPGSSPLSSLPSPLFTVRTPTAIVTDLGTEFGIEVEKSGATRSCVFAGNIEVQPRGPAGPGASGDGLAAPIRLAAGQAVRVANNGRGRGLKTQPGLADASQFPVRPGHVSEFVAGKRTEAFRRWQAYSQRLRKDSALLAYYTFESCGRDPTRDMSSALPNMAGTGQVLDGRIVGPRWVKGRFPEKFALRFWGPGYRDHVLLSDPERFHFGGPFSFAVWFESEMSGDGSGHLLSKGNQDWRLCVKPGAIHFITGDIERGATASDALTASGAFRPSDWHLVVATFDPGAHAAKKRLYIDGRLAAERSAAPLMMSQVHRVPVAIGDNAVWGPTGEFAGLIDEVAIFSRVLNADEVGEMFAAGNPPRMEDPRLERSDSRHETMPGRVESATKSDARDSRTGESHKGVASGPDGRRTHARRTFT
ncbi:MAG: LamG domain-containing protein [Thermoguttaceae bacterium]